MNPTTVTKCLVIQASSMLPELQDIVKSYAFYDTSSDKFLHRQKFRPTLQRIEQANSRKNGFGGFCEDDAPIEHWSYETLNENIQLQAVSCHICGEYVASNTLHNNNYHLDDISRQLCYCSHRYMLEEYEEYEEDYDY